MAQPASPCCWAVPLRRSVRASSRLAPTLMSRLRPPGGNNSANRAAEWVSSAMGRGAWTLLVQRCRGAWAIVSAFRCPLPDWLQHPPVMNFPSSSTMTRCRLGSSWPACCRPVPLAAPPAPPACPSAASCVEDGGNIASMRWRRPSSTVPSSARRAGGQSGMRQLLTMCGILSDTLYSQPQAPQASKTLKGCKRQHDLSTVCCKRQHDLSTGVCQAAHLRGSAGPCLPPASSAPGRPPPAGPPGAAACTPGSLPATRRDAAQGPIRGW